MTTVRQSVIAGTWYPGTKAELQRAVKEYLSHAELVELGGELVGLISPHAGYIYSGQVAAYAYKQVEGASYDVVAIVSPVHRVSVGTFAVTAADAYETPLGLVYLDQELVSDLGKEIKLTRVGFDAEHSLEIQLPFLQVALGKFRLLPVMMGDQSLAVCRRLGAALGRVLAGKNALLVASTDLSHFYPYHQAVQLDRVALSYIDNFDPEGLAQALATRRTEACGGGPVIAVMLAARALGATRGQVLYYANSGDVTGDHSQVVGYVAGALYRQ
ncbi:MAG TPA: AmmeMemoRadiSam system protein B [Anaerolineae bacterium]|nr:AmmeMemoRadiSam system protein B [Anaerolineae bacterium]